MNFDSVKNAQWVANWNFITSLTENSTVIPLYHHTTAKATTDKNNLAREQ